MKSLIETNYALNEIIAIYKLVQKKLGVKENKNLSRTYENTNEDKYDSKNITKLLTEKYPHGKAFFYFKNKNDYIILYSNGQLNVRGREEDIFTGWGRSEFCSFNPRSVFKELEKELIKINVTAPTRGATHSFNCYSDFINWLTK